MSYAAKNYAKRLAANSLFRNRQRLHALLAHIKDLILTVDIRQVCCEVTPSIGTTLKCQPEDIIGQSLATLVHQEDLPGLRQAIAVAMGNQSVAGERIYCRMRGKDSRPWRSFNVSVAAVAIDHRVTELLLICNDITERQRNEAILTTLRQTEARYRNIFENASEGIYQITPDGRYISANPQLARLLGYGNTEALLMDTSCTKSSQYCSPRRWLDFICALELESVLTNFESQIQRRDGSTLWVLENARGVCDRAGTLLYYEGTLSDMTYRKRSEEALQRANETLEQRVHERTEELLTANHQLRVEILERERAQAALTLGNQAMNACSNGIIISDARLTDAPFVYVNPAFESMTGYGVEAAIGQTYALLLGPKTEPSARARLWEALRQRKECRETLLTYRKDGSSFWCELSLSPIHDDRGQISHFVGIQNDISKRRQLEDDLQKALEVERELNEMKSRFISTASHEFRTPLTAILSSAEFLQEYGDALKAEKRDRQFSRIKRSVHHMTQLLDDVLHISKVEAGKIELNLAPLDVREFCLELVDELQPSFPDRAIALEMDLAVPVSPQSGKAPRLDRKLLFHILSNLISNAVKYSPESPTVWLSVQYQHRERLITFKVCDRGIGIPKDDLERLFESFHRAGNVGAISGTGLGLAIVHRIVDAHGGCVVVGPRDGGGRGSTVELQLPTTACERGAASEVVVRAAHSATPALQESAA